jgi:Ser/Thr protein kinase RdoA (MazF antagonist)
LGQEDAPPVVLKFYRAGRWSNAQILEEHDFAKRLQVADVPVAAPLLLGGDTLFCAGGQRMAAFPLVAGGAPDLEKPGALALLGRTLARLHSCGRATPFRYRSTLNAERLGARARRVLLASPWLPAHCQGRYDAISAQLLAAILDVVTGEPAAAQPIHGDCHLGNILWTERGPLFVDLDDCLSGPVIQDLWMFLSGSVDDQRGQWAELLDGYEQFAHIDYGELRLIEALRALRMLNYSAWIAERWDDPAFPRAFPWFTEPAFWERHINDLAEQIVAVGSPPLLGA